MPIHPDRNKQDPRSPQELAKAILDHVLRPRHSEIPYSLTFREQLLMDYDASHDRQILRNYGEPLVLVLKSMEEGATPGRKDKRHVSHALQVIDVYKKEATEWRDDDARESRDLDRPESLQRASAESMETQIIEIINLKAIEKLVRTLARKLGVSLIEPERGK